MKRLAIHLSILFFVAYTFTQCKVEGGSSIRSDVVLNLTDWNLPDTVHASTPFDITLKSTINNACTHNLRFIIGKLDDYNYKVYAYALYENINGEFCSEIVVLKDTVISKTLRPAGKYYFFFLKDDTFNKDSVIVIP